MWRVYFDPGPDGTRSFQNLASFEQGEPVAVYNVREFATADGVVGFVLARNDLELIESTPFTFKGVTIDFKDVAPRLMGLGPVDVGPEAQRQPWNRPVESRVITSGTPHHRGIDVSVCPPSTA